MPSSREHGKRYTKEHGGCITSVVDSFLNTYCGDISMKEPFVVGRITGEMVQASFSRTAESAGALDGWSPKELSLLSLAIYCHIAILLAQIEKEPRGREPPCMPEWFFLKKSEHR